MTVLEQQEGPYTVTAYRNGPWPHTTAMRDVISRRAFTSLDGPRENAANYVRSLIDGAGIRDTAAVRRCLEQLQTLPAVGGSVTLPDGTVIEVEKTTWRAIFDAIVAADPDAPGQSIPALPPDMWSESGKQAACRAFAASQENGGCAMSGIRNVVHPLAQDALTALDMMGARAQLGYSYTDPELCESEGPQPRPAEDRRGDLGADDRVVLALALGAWRASAIASVARCGEATARRVLAGPLCLRTSGRGDFDLTPLGRRRVGELTRALRDFEPTLGQVEACRVLLSIEREPVLERPPVVWSATFRCGRCDLTGRSTDDGDTLAAAAKCPQCGARELSFAPASSETSA